VSPFDQIFEANRLYGAAMERMTARQMITNARACLHWADMSRNKEYRADLINLAETWITASIDARPESFIEWSARESGTA